MCKSVASSLSSEGSYVIPWTKKLCVAPKNTDSLRTTDDNTSETTDESLTDINTNQNTDKTSDDEKTLTKIPELKKKVENWLENDFSEEQSEIPTQSIDQPNQSIKKIKRKLPTMKKRKLNENNIVTGDDEIVSSKIPRVDKNTNSNNNSNEASSEYVHLIKDRERVAQAIVTKKLKGDKNQVKITKILNKDSSEMFEVGKTCCWKKLQWWIFKGHSYPMTRLTCSKTTHTWQMVQ